MVWLLIAFVVVMAIVPLMHFAPSKRQREIAGLREQAAVGGLFVEFRDPPGAERGWPEDVRPGSIIYYGKRLPAKRQGRIAAAGWRCDNDEWRAVGGYVEVPESFASLPAGMLAASVDDGSCGVFWTESTGEAAVEQIRCSLEAWVASLCDDRG